MSGTFILPDLVADCNTYLLRMNPHGDPVARASEGWLLAQAKFDDTRREAFLRLFAGELTAACYPDTSAIHLRVVADFLNFLFTLDDWSDEFTAEDTCGLAECVMTAINDTDGYDTQKAAGNLAKCFFGRFRRTAGPGCTRRFIETMDLFFRSIQQQAVDRANGNVPALEEYIAMRYDTSGCRPCFALIEYAAGIDLPDEVVSHPRVRALEDTANAHISWSNDLFSYRVEHARGDTHNMIAVIMRAYALPLQGAVDFVGLLVSGAVQRFEAERQRLPSWGPEIDKDVAVYVQGLQDWMVGALHWSFKSGRYFGDEGPAIKKHRIVTLSLPRQP